jgi:hypothetical protein
LTSCYWAGAQSFGAFSFNSGNRQLIEEAIKDGLFIVCQSYQLQDTTAQTPTYYGWDNAEHFGYAYSLGIKVENGYYLDRKAVYPWQYDSRFDEYNGSRQYAPVVSAGKYRTLTDSVLFDFSFTDAELKAVAGEQFYFVQDSLFENKGFLTDDSDGMKKGWLVWLLDDFSLLVYRNELEFTAGKNIYPVTDPSANKEVLGGIYVVPQFDGIGQIRFLLSGLICGKSGQWQVVRPDESAEKPFPAPKPAPKGLTPVRTYKK